MTTKSIKHNYNTGTWNSWDLGVFEIPEQIQVLERMGEVTFSQIDERQETGHTENGYDVKLTKCTCPFHQETGLPCKHIYKLAFHLGKLRFNKNFIRSPKLIVDFENGFSKDWYFTIGTFHKETLDIKYTTKVIKGEKIKVLTQGDDYSFNVGAVFMDNPKAYELIWREAVLEIKYLLQIRSSYSNKKKISFYYENDVLVEEKLTAVTGTNDPADVVQTEDSQIINPLPDTTMENLTDAILSVSLDEGNAYVDDHGRMQMDLTIYSYDQYDMVDIANLKVEIEESEDEFRKE